MEFENKTRVLDSGSHSLGEIKVVASSWLWYVSTDEDGNDKSFKLDEHELTLNKAGALQLIAQLQIAVELIGHDYLVHDGGTITVDDSNYANIDDYRNGIVRD